jgi:tryptophanyl-tRNA synthetase
VTSARRARILSGIQPSGKLHLGNWFGAMEQHVALQDEGDAFYFIADYHALTTVQDRAALAGLVRDVALDYLALGLDPHKATFFRQSDVPEVCRAHLDAVHRHGHGAARARHLVQGQDRRGQQPRAGLFFYPVLMAADILLYQSDLVPVGKDQVQHLEMARDMADAFHAAFACEVFRRPEARLDARAAVVPGTDGQKMSKSYGNAIDIFAEGKALKTAVMSVKTDSRGVEEPKDPESCSSTSSTGSVAPAEKAREMADALARGGYGYGDAKKALLAAIDERFAPARERRRQLAARPAEVDEVLAAGGARARPRRSAPWRPCARRWAWPAGRSRRDDRRRPARGAGGGGGGRARVAPYRARAVPAGLRRGGGRRRRGRLAGGQDRRPAGLRGRRLAAPTWPSPTWVAPYSSCRSSRWRPTGARAGAPRSRPPRRPTRRAGCWSASARACQRGGCPWPRAASAPRCASRLVNDGPLHAAASIVRERPAGRPASVDLTACLTSTWRAIDSPLRADMRAACRGVAAEARGAPRGLARGRPWMKAKSIDESSPGAGGALPARARAAGGTTGAPPSPRRTWSTASPTPPGETKVVHKNVIQMFLDEIVRELASGNRLEFRDFGVFEVKSRRARRAQNPRTLEKVAVPPKKVVKFKVGRVMRECVTLEKALPAAARDDD